MEKKACREARHVYIDAGVNWCNTLELWRKVPEAQPFVDERWQIYGFGCNLPLRGAAACLRWMRTRYANRRRRLQNTTGLRGAALDERFARLYGRPPEYVT